MITLIKLLNHTRASSLDHMITQNRPRHDSMSESTMADHHMLIVPSLVDLMYIH